ncbi:MAG: TonB-dependent receptor [Acidobacteria bacterium]|nr:TonB-dependent receptor [Acidobacteriota bacterium]
MRRIYFAPWMTMLFLACLCAPLVGQVTTGTISGTVMDETGAVLPGVSLTVKNVATGIARTLVTSDQGTYRATALDLGDYEVQAELPGFQTAVRSGIKLTVGREAVVNFSLKVGEISERIVVTGEASLVSTTSATMAELVDDKKIRDLPLNGRDFIQLATLQPGVLITQTGSKVDQGNSSAAIGRGLGVKLSVSGGRTNANAFLLDGTDANDYANTTPGAITGGNLGVEAIREFQVLTNTYSAEYGRSAGGVISSVSRSGTNELHGSVFHFLRNDNLDAANFFDKWDPTLRKKVNPEFKRNQFGGAAGGPIVKDKAFFFANYEGLREGLGLTSISTVLTQSAKEGNLSTGRVTVDPAIKPILDLYPLPNGRIFSGGDTGEFAVATTAATEEDFVVGKVDHQLSGSHSYFVRYTFDDASIVRPDSLKINDNNAGSRRQFFTFDLRSIASPTTLNAFTFGFNRTLTFNGRLTPIVDLPNISFVPGRPMGLIDITGLEGFPGGPGATDLDLFAYNVFQWRDDLNWNRGRHSMKFGANVERIHMNMNSTNQENGNFRFGSIPDFLRNIPELFRTQVPGSDTVRGFRQNLIGFYFQDDIKVKSNLTLNAGVRYEFITDLTEVNGKVSNLRNFTDPQFTVGKIFDNPSLLNFAPRLGLAWDPTGSGKTAVRAGFGIFYDQILSHYFSGGFGVRVPPFFSRANLTGIISQGDFPTRAFQKFVTSGVPLIEGEWFDFNASQPYSMQFNLNVQRQLPGNMVATVGYVGYRGVHLKRIAEDGNIRNEEVLPDGRLFFRAGTPRRNPNFSGLKTQSLDAQSHYHGLQVGFNKRFSHGVQLQAAYTLSKSLDDASGVFNEKDLGNSNLYPFFWDSKFNRGLSDFDVRQNFVFNYTYELPIPKLSGAAGKIANGWQWGGILLAANGNPYTPSLGSDQAQTLSSRGAGGQRPDVLPGRNKIPSTGAPGRWFDPGAFLFPAAGFLGNLGKGTGVGDGVVTFDTTIQKNTYIDEERYLQFRLELFNVLNHANFSNPGRPVVFDRQGRVPGNVGRITSTATKNRQVQLSLKFIF